MQFFFAHKNLLVQLLAQFWLEFTCIILYIYYDNHCEVITCILLFACKNLSHHFIDCLGVFLVRLFMWVTGTVLCIPWPSTVPVYLSHWTYKSRPLTSAATSDSNMDPGIQKDEKAATSDLNIFIAFKNTEQLKTSSDNLQVHFSSYKVKWTFETCSLQYMSIKWYFKWDSISLI